MTLKNKQSDTVLSLQNLTCKYKDLLIFEGCNISLAKGEQYSLVGSSGCGKSSLLHMAGLLMKPYIGKVFINGKNTSKISDSEKTLIRRHEIGFVYQAHYLLPEYNALENVMMPMLIAGQKKVKAKKRAEELLTSMGLCERMSHQPSQLSGGEQQRVAIVRALAMSPKLVLADEPTGNLDPETSNIVFDYLIDQFTKNDTALIVATHDMELASKIKNKLYFENKRIIT